jgi:hypothetical protein
MTGWHDHSLNESVAVSTTWRYPWGQPVVFTPTKYSWDLHIWRLKSSQHLRKISTCPFDYLNFETRHLDERTVDHHKQTSKQRITAQDEIKSVQSREALSQSRRSKPGYISKKEFELDLRRKTYNCPEIGSSVTGCFPWVSSRRGRCWGPCLLRVPGMFGNIRLCSENYVELSSSGSVVAWEGWEIRLSCCNRHAVWCAVTRVIETNWWCK